MQGEIGEETVVAAGESGTSSQYHIKGNNSHVKAQVLLLLEEVVQDVLPDEVRV